jgi:hypothetical protein
VKTQIRASGWTVAASVCHFLLGDMVMEASVLCLHACGWLGCFRHLDFGLLLLHFSCSRGSLTPPLVVGSMC